MSENPLVVSELLNAPRIIEIEARIGEIDAEREALERELLVLRSGPPKGQLPLQGAHSQGGASPRPSPTAFADQVALFLELFRCRKSVYPKLWENPSKGTKGYSPVCDNEWVRGICGKPPYGRVKCCECPNQAFRELDERAVAAHLKGQAAIGTYAIREDDSCVFLACDFDGEGWKSAAFLYQAIGREMGVDVLVERSRSGNGAHSWIFFSEPIAARLARALGTLILAKCIDLDHRIEFASFDRFFPSQDFLPRGGFGNLIALPLQGMSRRAGNSVFISPDLAVEPDQWEVLARAKRLPVADVRGLLDQFSPPLVAVPSSEDSAMASDSAIVDSSPDLRGILPKGCAIPIRVGAEVGIPLEGLPSRLVAALKKTATFPNPVFYKLQRMRMATYPHPRFIFSGELRIDSLILPRGALDAASKLLTKAGASVSVLDERIAGRPIHVAFSGELSRRQEVARAAAVRSDQGILVAPPGEGKTVIACAVIADRRVATLILVHKQPLVDQWKGQLATLLGVPEEEVGVLSGSKKALKGRFDIAMLQTLARSDDVEQTTSRYGQLIIDECHHVPAVSFEAVMKRCSCKFILGLTATPRRKDGLERLLFHQCGPIRHEVRLTAKDPLCKRVTIRETGFLIPQHLGTRPPYHVVAELLATDDQRNSLIVADIVGLLASKRFPLVIADRKDQVARLSSMLAQQETDPHTNLTGFQTFHLDGSIRAKKRQETLRQMAAARADGATCILFATAALIGEGVDLPDLNALVLASPVSFEGRLVQYAGRLHRLVEGKTDVQIIDYVDAGWAVSTSMYRNRTKAYRKMGYVIVEPKNLFARPAGQQESLF